MLSTKARRVSVGARAGNARRSALRRGCGERFRTWAGKVWPIARGRGPGEPGTHARGAGARPEGSRESDARKFGPEGHFADARRRRGADTGGLPVPRGWGPDGKCRRTRRPALRLRECRRAGPALFRGTGKTRPMVRGQGPEKPGTHTRGARNADAGAAAQGNRSPRATRKKSEPASKRRNSIPCPGTFRKRNTLP